MTTPAPNRFEILTGKLTSFQSSSDGYSAEILFPRGKTLSIESGEVANSKGVTQIFSEKKHRFALGDDVKILRMDTEGLVRNPTDRNCLDFLIVD